MSSFDGDRPGAVVYIDLLAGDCAQLLGEQESWSADLVDPDNEPDLRLRALVYWLYAIDAYVAASC